MLLEKMNWMDVEKHLKHDQRIAFVLGATEQHGYLSLATDTLVPWKIACQACEVENVVLAPPLHFGFSHWAISYPGTLSLGVHTYHQMVQDLIQSALRAGFRRFFLLNGHSGNRGAREAAIETITDVSDARLWFYSWWELPETASFLKANGGMDHANWAENFPFTRITEVPARNLPLRERHFRQSASAWRNDYPDGVMGGQYQVADEIMNELLMIAIKETQSILRDMRD